MSVQLSEGSLAAILSGETVKFPKLQVLQHRRVNGHDEKERHQLILSDGINFFCLVMLGTHLNILIETGDIKKFAVIKLKKYSLEPVIERRKQKIIYILDLEVIHRGNQMCCMIGNPTRLECSPDREQRTKENISEKTMLPVKSTVDLHNAGPSDMSCSTSSDLIPLSSKEEWITLKPKTQILIVGASHVQISGSPDIMLSPSQENVDENAKAPEESTTQIGSSNIGPTSQEKVDEKCLPIFSLTQYFPRWTIKAWVTNKSTVHYWNNRQGKSFTIDLIDESGEIQAMAYNECCDLFYDKIEVNKSYYISKCKVIPTNRRYTSIKYEYQLVFTEHTKITPRNENALKMPPPCYNFQPIGNICNLPLNECIDVLGICKSMLDVENVQTKTSQNEIKKQDVTLVDNTNTEVTLTLWESDAGKLSECLHQVIAIKGAKILEYKGLRNITLTYSSSLKINPDIPLAHELRDWYGNIGWIQLSASISTSLPVNGGPVADSYKTLIDLQLCGLRGSVAENFSCSAFIVKTKKSDVLYKACPTLGCNKKLSELNESFWCDYCEREATSYTWRMILSVKIGDFTNQVWITCFNDVAERLLNVTADELARLSGTENQEKYDQVFQNVTFRCFSFTLRKRLDYYKGEERLQVIAVRVEKLNYFEHNRKLIRELRSKHICY